MIGQVFVAKQLSKLRKSIIFDMIILKMDMEVQWQSQPDLIDHYILIRIHTHDLQQINLLVVIIHHQFELLRMIGAVFSLSSSFSSINSKLILKGSNPIFQRIQRMTGHG